MWYRIVMARIETILAKMRPKIPQILVKNSRRLAVNKMTTIKYRPTRFQDLCRIWDYYFGEARQPVAVTGFTKHPGRETLKSTSRMTMEWQRHNRRQVMKAFSRTRRPGETNR
jgi:hypothetical protein